MGLELTRAEITRALENPSDQPQLSAVGLERFDAARLAAVLASEIARAAACGLSHIRINMNLTDAAALARALRCAALAGH